MERGRGEKGVRKRVARLVCILAEELDVLLGENAKELLVRQFQDGSPLEGAEGQLAGVEVHGSDLGPVDDKVEDIVTCRQQELLSQCAWQWPKVCVCVVVVVCHCVWLHVIVCGCMSQGVVVGLCFVLRKWVHHRGHAYRRWQW